MRAAKWIFKGWAVAFLVLALAGCTSSSDDDDSTDDAGDASFDIMDYTLLNGTVDEETTPGCLEMANDGTGGSIAFNTPIDLDVVRIVLEGAFLASRYRFHIFGSEGATEVQDGLQARFERNDGAGTSTMALYDTTNTASGSSSSMTGDLAMGDEFTQGLEFDRTTGSARVWDTNADSENDPDLFTADGTLGLPVGTVVGIQAEGLRLCGLTAVEEQ